LVWRLEGRGKRIPRLDARGKQLKGDTWLSRFA
jgi:hypothetical protein